MLHLTSIDDALSIFKALGSNIRVQLLTLLLKDPHLNMNELASKLEISNGALTNHIHKLEDAGIISIENNTVSHGNQKRYKVNPDKILIDINLPKEAENVFHTSVRIGHFFNYSLTSNCGLASHDNFIGQINDPRYFADSNRYDAEVIWFEKGFLEYNIPKFIPESQSIDQIQISFEIGTEVTHSSTPPISDVNFYLNDTFVGSWINPGDYTESKGIFTPDWWKPSWCQYGVLKLLVVNANGAYIDGLKISDVSIHDFDFDATNFIKFKIEVPKDSPHFGGLTLFGKNFGNYNQDIHVSVTYSPSVESMKEQYLALGNDT